MLYNPATKDGFVNLTPCGQSVASRAKRQLHRLMRAEASLCDLYEMASNSPKLDFSAPITARAVEIRLLKLKIDGQESLTTGKNIPGRDRISREQH